MNSNRAKPAITGTEVAEERTYSRAAEISRRIVGLVSRYTGRGPTRARTTLNTNIAVVVLEDALTKGELNLVAAGEADAVESMRRTYQLAMRDEAIAAVEEILDRKVAAALGDIDPRKNIAVEVFVLERVPETGITETAEFSRAGQKG